MACDPFCGLALTLTPARISRSRSSRNSSLYGLLRHERPKGDGAITGWQVPTRSQMLARAAGAAT
jgi:hypothetical protein